MKNEGTLSVTISTENICIPSDIHFPLGRSEKVLRDGILREMEKRAFWTRNWHGFRKYKSFQKAVARPIFLEN